MDREKRFTFAGSAFYGVLIIVLFSTEKGLEVLKTFIITGDPHKKGIITIITIGVAFFSSGSIGVIFNVIFIFFWRLFTKGLSKHPRKCDSYNSLIVHYQTTTKQNRLKEVPIQLQKYSPDMLWSFFLAKGTKSFG